MNLGFETQVKQYLLRVFIYELLTGLWLSTWKASSRKKNCSCGASQISYGILFLYSVWRNNVSYNGFHHRSDPQGAVCLQTGKNGTTANLSEKTMRSHFPIIWNISTHKALDNHIIFPDAIFPFCARRVGTNKSHAQKHICIQMSENWSWGTASLSDERDTMTLLFQSVVHGTFHLG